MTRFHEFLEQVFYGTTVDPQIEDGDNWGPAEEFSGDADAFATEDGMITNAKNSADDTAVWTPDLGSYEGEEYEVPVEGLGGADVGLLFGVQTDSGGWPRLEGYLAFCNAVEDELRIDRWENGSLQNSSAVDGPVSDATTLLLDFRKTDDRITVALQNDADETIATVSLDDDTYTEGAFGAYSYDAEDGWAIGSPKIPEWELSTRKTMQEAGEFEKRLAHDGGTMEYRAVAEADDGRSYGAVLEMEPEGSGGGGGGGKEPDEELLSRIETLEGDMADAQYRLDQIATRVDDLETLVEEENAQMRERLDEIADLAVYD